MPRFRVVIGSVLCVAGLVLACVAPAAASSPANISGIVTSQNGVP
jgi:hypothetical protein